jgi:hypothetical protein
MAARSRATGLAIGAAALVVLICSVLPVWRVLRLEHLSEEWSFGTLWQVGRHFLENYRDTDSTMELLTLHWWNALLLLLLVITAALAGRHVYRVCRRDPDEPVRLGWGLGHLAALRQQGTLLARGRVRPHRRAPCRARLACDPAASDKDRPLSEAERGLIRWLLEHGAAGAADFLGQLDRTSVAAQCPCGCPTVDLAVDGVRPPAGGDMEIQSDYQWQGPGGAAFGVFVFARAGNLAGLEVWSIDGQETPSRLPDPTELQPLVKR